MANSSDDGRWVQKIAVVTLGHRNPHAADIMAAFAHVGLEDNCVIDVNTLIASETGPDGHPDRRHGGRIQAQRDVIGHPGIAATVIECLKLSTLSPADGKAYPIHIRVSDGPTVAAVVGRCEAACLNHIRSEDGWTYNAGYWELGDLDPEDVEPTIESIIE